jgi:N-acetylglucosaminyldiphosphoundecaprenol N-acetyl-beta-D-mannosaminyltransferase
MLGVGAAFDFHSGRVRQAPHWMQAAGLEWVFRLLMDPRRLWKRYAKHNPRFVGLFLMQLLGLRCFGEGADLGSSKG